MEIQTNLSGPIYILDDYQHVIQTLNCFSLLKGLDVRILHHSEKNPAKLAQLIKDAEILVLTRERTEISAELLDQLPKLKLISQTGKISKHIDLEACSARRVAVAEGVGSPIAPAELCWTLILNACRQVPQAIQAMREGKWQVNIGSTVQGKTIGIWGYGKIGKKIAEYARVFGANVLVWGSDASRANALQDGFKSVGSKAAFFRDSDVLTLHLRLNEKTQGIISAADLALMKESAVFVNTARAELLEPDALIQALKAGRPGFAALDVYESEPIYDPEFEFLKMPNVICTPHLGYVERNGYELYFQKAFENVLHYISGNPTNIANPIPNS